MGNEYYQPADQRDVCVIGVDGCPNEKHGEDTQHLASEYLFRNAYVWVNRLGCSYERRRIYRLRLVWVFHSKVNEIGLTKAGALSDRRADAYFAVRIISIPKSPTLFVFGSTHSADFRYEFKAKNVWFCSSDLRRQAVLRRSGSTQLPYDLLQLVKCFVVDTQNTRATFLRLLYPNQYSQQVT